MINFRHLYYFWVVAQQGSFMRAASHLDMAVQTITAQVRALELSLGHQLLKPSGRGVVLTEAGSAAVLRAEEIFRMGELIPDEVRQAATRRTVRLAVGLTDGISKLAAHRILEPVLDTSDLKIICHEGEFDPLLTELSLHQLDVVLAQQAAPRTPHLRLSSERIASSPIEWYGPARLASRAERERFPQCLEHLPVLLPTPHSAVRSAIDHWFESVGIRPRVVGEFEDSALLAIFAARGLGVFPVSELGATDVTMLRGLRRLGQSEAVREEIHAIRARRGQHHPVVTRLINLALGASAQPRV